MLSEETIKYIASYFIGDYEGSYSYKSGPQIYSFFRNYFNINISYGDEKPIPSRWMIAKNRIIELIHSNRINDFFTLVLSDHYLSKELDTLDITIIEEVKQKHFDALNLKLSFDNYKIIKNSDKLRLVSINDDELYLGDGGFATCYYVKSQGLVVKRLKEEYRLRSDIKSRFKREYSITKELNSKEIPGVITVYDYNEKDLSYTMEKAEMSLFEYVSSNKLEEKQKLIIIFQILDVMIKVHNENIIHRDLSPGNILLFNGLFKLSDFGFGKDIDANYSHITDSTAGYGTWSYADPKVVLKLKEGNKLTDIYSIGKLINYIMKGNPADNDHVLGSVSDKATNANDAFRYQSVAEMKNSLVKVINYHNNKEKEKELEECIKKGIISDEVHEYINSFDSKKIFERIQNKKFCSFYVKLLESKYESEEHIQNKLSDLYDYVQNLWHKKFDELDCLCDLAIPLILGKHDYVTWEVAVNILNIPLGANRFYAMRRVEKEIIDNIDPSLEERLLIK